jgi:hypothetical protein
MGPRFRSKVDRVLLSTGLKPGPNYVPWSIKTTRQRFRLVVACLVLVIVVAVISHL